MANVVEITTRSTPYNVLNSGGTYVLKSGSSITGSAHGIYEADDVHDNIYRINGNISVQGPNRCGLVAGGADTTATIGKTGVVDGNSGVYSDGAGFQFVNRGAISGTLDGIILAGDAAAVHNYGTVSGDMTAVHATGGNLRLVNDGMMSAAATAVQLSGATASFHNSGTVSGDIVGITSEGDDVAIVNDGTIIGATKAVQISGVGVGFVNNAAISGDIYVSNSEKVSLTLSASSVVVGGIDIGNATGIATRIVNNGEITDSNWAFYGGNGNETFVNRGAVSGSISMGAGNDVFDNRGGTVDHEIRGSSGNDTYILDSKVAIDEIAGWGIDTVKSTISMSLSSALLKGEELEKLVLIGGKDINATGNDLDNTLKGNIGDNVLSGLEGYDLLTGGAGADVFVFRTGGATDRVTDFGRGADRIDLSAFEDIKGFGDLVKNHIEVMGKDVVFHLGADSIVLENTDVSDLSRSDFLF